MTWTVNQIIHDRYELLGLKRDRPGRQVWLAFDQRSQAKVILKTLAFTGTIQWDDVKLFEREISVLKRLHHPQLPSFVDAFNLEQPHFQKCLVETYIHAPTLQAFLDRKQLIPDVQIWSIATQVLTILNDLHSLSPPILHRDLKPSNILIDSEKRVYLIDLGSVGTQGESNSESLDLLTTVGSYGYAPMEQFMGQSSPASDLYALGAILLSLLTQTHPSALMTPQQQLVFPTTVSLPAPLRQWINQLIEPDVTHRLSTARQALNLLEQAQDWVDVIDAERQATRSSMPADRVSQSQTSEALTLKLAPVWNRQTIAIQDVLLLSLLAFVPPLLGLSTVIGLSGASPSLNVLGLDMLLLSLSLLPSIFLGPRLFWNLLEQVVDYSATELTLTRKFAGIPIQTMTLNATDVTLFQITPRNGWTLVAHSAVGTEHDIFWRLPVVEIDKLYQDLDAWRVSMQT